MPTAAKPKPKPKYGSSLSIYGDLFGSRKARHSTSTIAERATNWRYGARATASKDEARETLVDVLDAVQAVVDTLTDGEGGRYRVSLSDQATASTNLQRKTIVISYKALDDPRLTLAQITEVLTGLSIHEIGHTAVSPMTHKVLDEHFPGDVLAKFVSNVLDDERLEWMQRRDYPGVAGALRPTGEWMARQSGLDKAKPQRFTADLNLTERANFMCRSIRYFYALRWVGDALTRSERSYWQDLARRYCVEAWTEPEIKRFLDEAIARLRAGAPDEEELPEPEPDDQDEGDEQGDESESEPSEGEGEGGVINTESMPPQDDDDAEIEEAEESVLDALADDDDDADDESDGDDESDEDESDEGDDDESDGAVDEDGNDLGEEPDDDAEADEQDAEDGRGGPKGDGVDESKDDDESDEDFTDDVVDENTYGGQGKTPAKADNAEPLDLDRLDKGIDDLRDDANTYVDRQLQEALDQERMAEKVVDRHGYGSMKVNVHL